MSKSKFIKRADGSQPECGSCGSSMLRRELSEETGKLEVVCFCCGAGAKQLKDIEACGLDALTIMELLGREHGTNEKILPRLNTPGGVHSSISLTESALDLIVKISRDYARIMKEEH